MKLFLAGILCFITYSSVQAQVAMKNEDYEYSKSVSSIVLSTGDPSLTTFPAVSLNGDERMSLKFDYFLTHQKTLTYKILHCDRNWQPSNLRYMDYMQGYEENQIRDPKFFNTTSQDYVTYSLELPNRDISFLISGNYLIHVFDDGELLFTRRFFVFEQKIGANIDYERAINLHDEQSFDVELDFSEYRIRNPKTDVFLSVYQNGRWDNALACVQPLYFFGTTFSFDRNRGIVFKGGKDFRVADLRSITQYGQNVKEIRTYVDGVEVELFQDQSRANGNVILNEEDLNGKFWLNAKNTSGVGSMEYVDVLFSLKHEFNIPDENIYLVGKFTNWQCLEEYRMEYDPKNEDFFLYASLRQGVYDYGYAVKGSNGRCSQVAIDGSWNGTENEYAFVVYVQNYAPFLYDRIVYFDQRVVRP